MVSDFPKGWENSLSACISNIYYAEPTIRDIYPIRLSHVVSNNAYIMGWSFVASQNICELEMIINRWKHNTGKVFNMFEDE